LFLLLSNDQQYQRRATDLSHTKERLIGVCIIGGNVFIVLVGGWGYVVQVGSTHFDERQIDVALL
jgi:hypothetical protein